MSRWGPSVDGSLTTLVVVVAGVAVLSVVALQARGGPATVNGSGALVDGGQGGVPGPIASGGKANATVPGDASTAGPSRGALGNNGPRQVGGQQPGGASGGSVAPGAATCGSGSNGGSTDRGVSATSIKLGATVVQSGIGASFLGSVPIALTAVKNQVNQAGGICGRRLALKLVDDGWDPPRGLQYIQNLVDGDKVFALAVNPSSEGLRLATGQRYLSKTKTPVVGSDGMLNAQYSDPWIWPIAASTVSTMHIIASDACQRLNKKQFSIVFDRTYHFGVEGAFAFNAAVKRCTGKDIPGYQPGDGGGCSSRFCAIPAGQTNYDSDNKTWNDQCFTGVTQCDFVALLLEPNEAQNFLRNGTTTLITTGLAQTLFTKAFASGCGKVCDQAVVWTGYNPPIEQFAALPAVKAYVQTVRSEAPDVDVLNQFLEGGYAGMQLLVDALRRTGPNLTRERLAAVLDSTDYDAGLTTPLRWRPGNHFANASMQGFAIQYKGGNFNGFRHVTGWVRDPYVGQDVG